MNNFKPNDKVKICKYIESGVRFYYGGITCCCANTFQSPIIITAEEMKSGKVTYELIIQRRIELFERLNGLAEGPTGDCLKCNLLMEREYKDVNFDYLGGHGYTSGFNIQHFTSCNLRCSYCSFTTENNFKPPVYTNLIEFIELFRSRGKLIGGNWIEFNGGEPTILEDFDEILDYLTKNNCGTVMLFSNSLKYSESVYNALKENKIFITTSIDAGTPSTYKKMKRVDGYIKVIENMIRYKMSGTKSMFVLKYIICEENRSNDDLYGFVFAILLIRPTHVYICPDFPYGDKQIPDESVEFGARMWLILEKYGKGFTTVYIQSDDMKGDPKFAKYSGDIRAKYNELKDNMNYEEDLYNIVKFNEDLSNINFYNKLNNIQNNINKLAWWIPIRKWRDNFRNKILNADQTRPDQTRPDLICNWYIYSNITIKINKLQPILQYKITA
ncbi:radical SAM protein [uncultured Brachyspira sp.]|uniref:radical SAM protein n=1 Tax=uncultured Brachyspira sp. TaxID=221953 RepID=UPI0025F238DF|nr:radical SAM protein [uncultured Brachyspira sp.]